MFLLFPTFCNLIMVLVLVLGNIEIPFRLVIDCLFVFLSIRDHAEPPMSLDQLFMGSVMFVLRSYRVLNKNFL